MNKLLIHMMNAGDVDHRILPGVKKMQFAGTVPPKDLNRYDNLASPAMMRGKIDRELQARQARELRAMQEKQGTIRQAEPAQSKSSKVWNVLTHPMTALQYKMPYWSTGRKAPDLPEHFERGPINTLEYATNIINPFGIVDAAASIPGNVARGELLSAGLNALAVAPALGELRSVAKTSRVVPKVAKTYKTFANNSTPGLMRFLLSPNRVVNPAGIMSDHGFGILKGTIEQGRGLFREGKGALKKMVGMESDHLPRRPFFETFPITKAQKAKVVGMQDEALESAQKFTNDYWYGGGQDIRPVLEDKMRNILPDLKMAKNRNNLERTYSPLNTVPDRLVTNTTWGAGREGLSDDVINYLDENRGRIGGVNNDDVSITLRNSGLYYSTPREIANVAAHEAGHSAQKLGILGDINEANKTWADELTTFSPKYNYWTSNPNTELGLRFQNALVAPKNKLFGTSASKQTWRSAPIELHSELMASKYNMYKKGLSQGYTPEEMMSRATNPGERELKWLLNNKSINKHFKESTPLQEKLDLLKLLPATVPAVAGAAALQEQKYGGQPCYECGGNIMKYDMGGYYDCPDQEKDPETGKCKAEVVRSKEQAAANKAASADLNAWAKQVAAIDRANAQQDAAQYAGQKSFDYDWMQSPVEKAEKKAAIAAYKQFFQQNPNTFVPDDTSGFSPEQKYIIASKLKQKASTNLGAKAFQQKFNQDPRFFDLDRLQKDIVPIMGGWDATRNWMFNNKKLGGPIVDPRGQWAHPGKVTRIPSSSITMEGVPYPVLGIGNNGKKQVMYPGQNYQFGGAEYVDEYPMMAQGGQMIRRADGSYSQRGLWDNIRANAGSGKKPSKQMLEQERKIKSKNK